MILSLSSVRTHATPDMFFPGRNPLSTPMIPFRAHALSGTGNGKPKEATGGGGDEIGAACADDMDSRPGNFSQWARMDGVVRLCFFDGLSCEFKPIYLPR